MVETMGVLFRLPGFDSDEERFENLGARSSFDGIIGEVAVRVTEVGSGELLGV